MARYRNLSKGDKMKDSKDVKILIVEDDEDINNLLREILESKGYNVKQGFSGTEGRLLYKIEKPDLVILDLMMPGLTGEELVGDIRDRDIVPIIIISAKLDTETKVDLLSLGADDFIEKPFELSEVLARVEAQLRRYFEFNSKNREKSEGLIKFKNLVVNVSERKVLVNNSEIRLTVKEYDILNLLLTYPKKVFTKANIYESIWGDSAFMDDNTLNVHISNLRTKIEKYDSEEDYIETVWGIGFKLKN